MPRGRPKKQETEEVKKEETPSGDVRWQKQGTNIVEIKREKKIAEVKLAV